MKNLRIAETSPFPAFNPEYREFKVLRDHTFEELSEMHEIQKEEEIKRGFVLATFPSEIQAVDFLEQARPYHDDKPLFSWNDIQAFIHQHNISLPVSTELRRLRVKLINQKF